MKNEIFSIQELELTADKLPQVIEAAFEDGDVYAANQLARLTIELDEEIAKATNYLKELKLLKSNLDASSLQAAIKNKVVNVGAIKLVANPQAAEIVDIDLIPAEYLKSEVKVTPDKMAIKNAMKVGVDIPGAKLVQGCKLKINKKAVIFDGK